MKLEEEVIEESTITEESEETPTTEESEAEVEIEELETKQFSILDLSDFVKRTELWLQYLEGQVGLNELVKEFGKTRSISIAVKEKKKEKKKKRTKKSSKKTTKSKKSRRKSKSAK